jgi:hypothetical protein
VSTSERFFAKIAISGDCWVWTGSRGSNGYGQFFFEGRLRKAHRVSYAMAVGPIPTGLDLDHLCRNRACVRPSHLEPVTRRENLIRGAGFIAKQAAQTHCLRGHPLFGENLYRRANGKRECRVCRLERQRSWKAIRCQS